MQESIVFLVRVQCRYKENSRSLSHLLMSFLSLNVAVLSVAIVYFLSFECILCVCVIWVYAQNKMLIHLFTTVTIDLK